MLKYHGTPLTPKAQLERMRGRNFCVPYPRPDNLAHCLRIGQSIMFDNGAFSVKTRGEVFDLHGFYEWVEPHLQHPHWAVVPDEIDGTVEQQRRRSVRRQGGRRGCVGVVDRQGAARQGSRLIPCLPSPFPSAPSR